MELLRRMVSVGSVFPEEAELAHFLSSELERRGFSVEMQRFGGSRYNVLATRAPETEDAVQEKPILLYGHMDTVPPYGYEAEGRDPYVLEERDGRLYGLGAYDMKAGLAAILHAVGESGRGRALKVMFVSDEEADSRGCHEAVRSGFLRDVGFALSTEISDVNDSDERTRTITLGRRGRAQYSISVPGRSFHAARAAEGVSAVTEAAKLAVAIEGMNSSMPRHEMLGEGDMFVRKFFSESVSLSVPDEASLVVDRHLVLPEDAEGGRADLQSRVDALYSNGTLRDLGNGRRAAVKVVPREVPYLMPYATAEENPEVRRLAAAVKGTLGVDARYNCGRSVADENLIAMQGVPVVSYGPIGGGEHSSGEWVSKKSYLELIDVLKAFLG